MTSRLEMMVHVSLLQVGRLRASLNMVLQGESAVGALLGGA